MILTAKRAITGDGKTVLKEAGILVREGKIQKIAAAEDLKKMFPDESVTDYGDATIIPGYIDMHTHMGCYDGVWDVAQYNGYRQGILGLQQTEESFMHGVTTIRDAGCPDRLLETLRIMQTYGYVTLPRIFHCNQAIAMTGGHCYRMSIVTEADGIDGLRTEIRRQIRAGADWIKIMTTHRMENPVEYSQEELNFAVQETHRLGKKCFIHAALQPGLQMAIDACPDSIEHGTYMTLQQAQQMIDKGIYWCPTLASLEYIVPQLMAHEDDGNAYYQIQIKDREYYANNAKYIRGRFLELANTGIKIVAGTDFDTGYIPSAPVGMELRYMHEFGWDPCKIIQAGTYNGAELLGISDTVGLLKEGYEADIAILGGDPLTDKDAYERILATYFGGKCVYTKA